MKGKITKIGIVSLGCPKNLADVEAVLAYLENIQIVNEKDADVILLNTCGFLKAARDEVFDNINRLKNKKIIVLGCLAGEFSKENLKKYPQIYGVLSSANYSKIQKTLDSVMKNRKIHMISKEPTHFESFVGKSLITPRSYSYVKIAEGCDNRCSYCYIPYLKGKYRSRKMEEIVEEVKDLVKLGVKEIVLVAQDCGYYGKDLYGKFALSELLKKLENIKGDFWIRVLYIYPERINDELLKVISESKKICKYLDIPLQHGDKDVLKKMYRPSDTQKILQRINKIKEKIPGVFLRTSLIVGFPGETEKSFKNLSKFIEKIDFDNVGAFEYSREPNTPAYSFKPQISEKTKHDRYKKVMLLQKKISLKKNKKLIGKTFKTLIENFNPGKKTYIGRCEKFAPEIDGNIFVKSDKILTVPDFYNVKITGADHYDLHAVVAELVDAHVSGACSRKGVRVQVPPTAPI